MIRNKVPTGWARGEPIEIEQIATGRFIVAQRLMPNTHPSYDDIAYISFPCMSDLLTWLKWWYNDPIHTVTNYEIHIH